MRGFRYIDIHETSIFLDPISQSIKLLRRWEISRSMSMRKYPCLVLTRDSRLSDYLFSSYHHGNSLLDMRDFGASLTRMLSVFIRAFFIYHKFQYVRSVRMIAKVLVIQSLALNQTWQLFFCIESKDQEYGPCRSNPLVKSLRSAGMPMFPGAVHEFA
jgi:hypothetical protein